MPVRIVAADGVDVASLTAIAEDPAFQIVAVGADELRESLSDAAALIVRSATKVDADLLDHAGSLRIVARAGVGVDNIDIAEATRRGIAVFNTPEASTLAVAELTMALILDLVRHVAEADRSIRDGAWDRSALRGVELWGKTLGLVGAGRIGREVASRARAFGMIVLACDPYLDDCDGMELCSMERVLGESDVVSLHVPLTEETRHLLDHDALALMRPGSFLVNVSRGGIIDEAALAAALQSGRLAGAALDVYEHEPLPADSPLRRAPHLVLTPHLGASTMEAQRRVAVETAEAVHRALSSGDLSGAVNAAGL